MYSTEIQQCLVYAAVFIVSFFFWLFGFSSTRLDLILNLVAAQVLKVCLSVVCLFGFLDFVYFLNDGLTKRCIICRFFVCRPLSMSWPGSRVTMNVMWQSLFSCLGRQKYKSKSKK